MLTLGNFSLPLLSIPAYYVLAVFPHGYAVMKASKGNLKAHDNSNPHGSKHTKALERRLTAQELAAYERGERCHRNHFENMPLFIGTVLIGFLAEQKDGPGAAGLDLFVASWLVVRVLYTVSYLTTESHQWSLLRSLLYFVGSFWAFAVIGKAAYVFGA